MWLCYSAVLYQYRKPVPALLLSTLAGVSIPTISGFADLLLLRVPYSAACLVPHGGIYWFFPYCVARSVSFTARRLCHYRIERDRGRRLVLLADVTLCLRVRGLLYAAATWTRAVFTTLRRVTQVATVALCSAVPLFLNRCFRHGRLCYYRWLFPLAF